MSAFSAEPWRALARIQIVDSVAALFARNYTVSVDTVSPNTATGNQATWEGAPGSALTFRVQWDVVGIPPVNFGQAENIIVKIRLPSDGTDIGATWTVPTAGAASGLATKTFHFDDNPLDSIAGTARGGMVEALLSVEHTAAPTWGPADSRGASSNLPPATTHNWARGYWRARRTLSAYTISNVALAGAEPANWCYPDSVYQRATLDAVSYRATALANAVRQSAADRRTDPGASTTSVTRDYSWTTTATTVAGLGRVNTGQWTIGSAAADVRFTVPSATFGGSADREYEWAASGHVGTFSPSGANLDAAARITVDPRVQFRQLMRLNNNTFATPPMSADVPSGQRTNSDIGYLAAQARNMRATPEGLNGLVWTEKVWDDGNLTGSEASPVVSRSATGTTQGGEAGWSDVYLVWDQALPGGMWDYKQVITTTDAVGLETGNLRQPVLLSANAGVNLRVYTNVMDRPDGHFTPGRSVRVTANLVDVTAAARLAPDVGSVRCVLLRYHPIRRRLQYLADDTDNTEAAWADLAAFGSATTFLMTAEADDANLFYRDFTQTAGWAYDIRATARCTFLMTPYGAFTHDQIVAPHNRHDRVGVGSFPRGRQ